MGGKTLRLAAVGALVVGLSGCGADTGSGQGGGTLRVVGSSDLDHVDTASGYSTGSGILSRQYARTLFNFRASSDFEESIKLRADVAVELPTTSNGGVSLDGRTYTIKLREGVLWNTQPPREVTAADFIRGIKRLCNPAQPSGALSYFTATIEGLKRFCSGYGRVDGTSPRAMAAYQNNHQVAGLAARGDKTLVITLTKPATDFTNIMGMQFAAAAPREYDTYVPDSPEFRTHTISNGPYQISAYTSGKEFTLDRNPNWTADRDPLRRQNPARIQITLGQDSPESVQRMLEQGSADLAWDQAVPTARIQILKSDPNFEIMDGAALNPYLVFNVLSPNHHKALAKPQVRRAIQYAINKSALLQIYGGPDVAKVQNQVITPGNVGYQEFNLYPTPGNSGDPATCKQILTAAGAPDLTLKFPYRTQSIHPKIAQSVQADLKKCGITAALTPDANGDFYGKTLVNPAAAKEGRWDIAAPGWVPDWYGNNGRTSIVPLFDGRTYGPNSTDFGGYNNPEVNTLIDQALDARSADDAARLWAQADRKIMQDAAIVPFMVQKYPIYHSSRVRNALYLPQFQNYDYNQTELS